MGNEEEALVSSQRAHRPPDVDEATDEDGDTVEVERPAVATPAEDEA